MTTVERFPPGESPTVTIPGDFFVVRDWHEDKIGNLIQAGERTRFGNTDPARWTHSGLIVDNVGGILEANQGGIEARHIDKYKAADLHVVHVVASGTQRNLAVAFAKAQQGTPYDVLDFVGLAVQSVFGLQISLHSDKRFICSGLVARATEKYVAAYPRSPESMMPADLAHFWGATSGEPMPKLNLFSRFLNLVAAVGRLLTFRKAVKPPPPSA